MIKKLITYLFFIAIAVVGLSLAFKAARLFNLSIEEIYYCPHHSDNEKCLCRKPEPLMIQKAMARYGIDPQQSWMIGDSQRDIEAGEAAGLKTIMVESNGDLVRVLGQIIQNL